jgi:hypothetical protein
MLHKPTKSHNLQKIKLLLKLVQYMQLTQKWLYISDLKTTNSVKKKKKKKQSTYPSPKKFKKQKGSKIVKLVLPCRCIAYILPSWLACFLICLLAPLEVALRLQQQMGALCLGRFLLQQKKFKPQHSETHDQIWVKVFRV